MLLPCYCHAIAMPCFSIYYFCSSASIQADPEEAASGGGGGGFGGALPLPPPRAQVPLRERSSGKRGAWLLTESRALERLTDVLEERAVELAEFRLGDDAYLPFAQQKKVQERLRQRWLESPDGRHYAEDYGPS